MRQTQTSDRPLSSPVVAAPAAPARAGLGALVLRLAIAVLLLAGLTVLASVALATDF
jgi:hypothetical protein